MDDVRFMREAIRLSRKGFPAPNPHVGCVIVLEGEIVGRGFHDHAGGPHAEVVALKSAGQKARGATAYVTLEPCNHQGRTGPCSLALIEAGIRRVVIAVQDPNPRAQGGVERLRKAGLEVLTGVLVSDAENENHQFLFAMSQKRPLVVAKAASSLDGRIALPNGESQWITGPKARKESHRLRAELGAVLVGRRTVELDDPLLTARIPGVVNQPLRVVLDPQGRLDNRYNVFNNDAPTLHLTNSKIGTTDAGFDLASVLDTIGAEGATGLLIEGGAKTLAGFIRARLVDRFELFLAPKLLGAGPTWLEGEVTDSLQDAPQLSVTRIRRLGPDIHLTADPNWPA